MKPKTIFKYQNTSAISISNLEKQILYMAPPTQFNDPYDCDIKYDLVDYNFHEAEVIRQKFIESESSPERKQMLSNLESKQFKVELEKGVRKAFNDAVEYFLKNSGVCCFSEINDDLLMWAHYGGSYTGFCLEFRTEFDPFNKLYKVKYIEYFKKIDFVNLLFNEDGKLIEDFYCTKGKHWEYEREWRIIHAKNKTEYHYELKCLKAIYFGPKIEKSFRAKLILTLQKHNPNVELWEGALYNNKFGIYFQRIDNLIF